MPAAQEKVISARVPAAMFDEVEAVAGELNKKRGAVVRDAVELYLATWADYKIAIERLKNPNDKTLTEKEFLDDLGWKI